MAAMSTSIFNTPYASLDSAITRSKLEHAHANPDQLREVLTDCFFDGSSAASEAAAIFVLNTTSTEENAVRVSDIIKSLPTAIPERTAAALAQICVFLAVSFHDDGCREPLNTFCYADSTVKQFAIKATISALDDLLRLRPRHLRKFLDRTALFFVSVLGQGSNVRDRLVALRDLVSVGVFNSKVAGQAIVDFILGCASEQNESQEVETVAQGERDYDVFFASELVTLAHSSTAVSQVVLRCLLRSAEWSSVSIVYSLWMNKNSKVLQCLPIIGLDVFLFFISLIAVSTACRGKISECRQAMSIALNVLQNGTTTFAVLDDIVSSSISSFCIAVAAMCSACGATDIAESSAIVRDLVRGLSSRSKARDVGVSLKSLEHALEEAGRWKCSKMALSLGLLVKLSSIWRESRTLKDWLDTELAYLLSSTTLDDIDRGNAESMYQTSLESAPGGIHDLSADDGSEGKDDVLAPICIAGVGLVCLSHIHSQVRYAAAKALANVRRSQVLLFFIPAVITHLESERNGVISVFCIQQVLLSPCLLSHEETCNVAFHTLLALISSSRDNNAIELYQSGLVAIAGAVKTAPIIAMSVLLAELEKLKNSFGLLSAETKAAACAAILTVVSIRPTRGKSLIPFISLCISRENMESAPESSSLSFDAMRIMCQDEILDAVKAVKIILKSFPDVLDVHERARKSYLRLLGQVSPMVNRKKGRIVAERVIILLRNILTDLYPSRVKGRARQAATGRLTWEEIGEAADSLAKYTIEDVLRIDHAQEEVFADAEAEQGRLEEIAVECMKLVNYFISVAELARRVGAGATKQLQSLVDKIVQHEWENRQRRSFDPERISKLRATSDALRRARQARGATVEIMGCETASQQFLKAVSTLPVGVIRGVCERCARGEGTSEEMDESVDMELSKINGRVTALRAMVRAEGLSVAFPWAGLAEEILGSDQNGAEEKAAALAVLANVKDRSFDEKGGRTKWFGDSCPLLNQRMAIEDCEAKEMFVGMVKYSGEEVGRKLQGCSKQISRERLLLMITATLEYTIDEESMFSIVEGLMEIIACMQWAGDVKFRGDIEKKFAELLSQLRADHLVHILEVDGTTEILTRRERCQMRIICHLNEPNLLSRSVCKVVRAAASGVAIEAELRGMLGRGVCQMTWEQRKALVYEICGMGTERGSVVELEMGAYCLGVGGLLTNEGDRAIMMAAKAICSRDEKVAVAKLVGKLCGRGSK